MQLIFLTIALVLYVVVGAWLHAEAEDIVTTFYGTKPEVFARTFGSSADASDGTNEVELLATMMSVLGGLALLFLVAAFACIVKLIHPFEAAMHWLEWVKLFMTFLGCLIVTFGLFGYQCASLSRRPH